MYTLYEFYSFEGGNQFDIIESCFCPSVHETFNSLKDAKKALMKQKDDFCTAWLIVEFDKNGSPIDSYDRTDERLVNV